uniref:Uncharacterized protein n=1 Tax=Timema monikensis TaxID=170555 RepID=A0A7R9EIV8_9NEOP|nr:unnamed protein product [Timema monikensis]
MFAAISCTASYSNEFVVHKRNIKRHTMYIQQQFEGVGICAVNLVDDMQEYMRGLFLIMDQEEDVDAVPTAMKE